MCITSDGTLNEEAERALRSTSNYTSEPYQVAQYRFEEGVGLFSGDCVGLCFVYISILCFTQSILEIHMI